MSALRSLPAGARLFVLAVLAAGLVALALQLPAVAGWSMMDASEFAALALATVVGERFLIEVTYRSERATYSLTDVIWTAALFLAEPSVLVLAAGAGVLVGQALQPWAAEKVAFNAGQGLLAVSAAVGVFGLLGAPAVTEPQAWLAAGVAMAAFQGVNTLLVGEVIALAERKPFARVALVPTGVLHWVGNIAIGILAALLWELEAAALPLLFIPVLLAYSAYRGWLRTAQERDWMRETAHEADGIARSADLTRRLEPRADGAVGDLVTTLNHMLDRVEHAFDRERRFIRETSHELRTPITICRGHLEVLGPSPTPAELQETVALVVDELDRMARLVDDMRTLARVEDPATLRVDEVEMDRFVADVAAKARGLLDGRLRVAAASAPGAAPLRADAQRLTQALINLLKNAEEHTRSDSPIDLRVVGDAQGWRFEVADAGGGLRPGEEQQVFRPFVSGPGSSGSGLGLAIVSGIARAHGGSAGVDNRPGDGATFWVRVPR